MLLDDPPDDLTTSVDDIVPYNQTTSEVQELIIDATGDEGLDNVSLYYRWWSDNNSWDSTFSYVYNTEQGVNLGSHINRDSAIDIDSSDVVHTVYRDGSDNKIYYGYRQANGTWRGQSNSNDLDTIYASGSTTHYVYGIGINSSDVPSVAFRNKFTNNLLFYWWNGTAWNTDTIATDSSAGTVRNSFHYGTGDKPHIAYENSTGLCYTYNDSGTWRGISNAASPDIMWEGNPSFISMALDSNNYPHTVFQSGTPPNTKLYYTYYNGTDYETTDLSTSEGITVSGGNTYCYISVNSSDSPFIVCREYTGSGDATLTAIYKDGASWVNDTVFTYSGNTGSYPCNTVSGDDEYYISAYDPAGDDFCVWNKTAPNTWSKITVDEHVEDNAYNHPIITLSNESVVGLYSPYNGTRFFYNWSYESTNELMEYHDSGGSGEEFFGSYLLGQTFTVGTVGNDYDFTCKKVGLMLRRYGSPPQANVSIWDTSGGLPNTKLTEQGIDTDTVVASPTHYRYNVTFENPISLSSGTMYAVAIDTDGDFSNTLGVEYDTSGSYTGGSKVYRSGGSWANNSGDDLQFYIYGQYDEIPFIEWDDASNPDTSSPWQWTFDFPDDTGHYQFFSRGADDDVYEGLKTAKEASCYFKLFVNQLLELTNPSPANGSDDQETSLTWSITIEDPDGMTFDWTIECSNGDTSSGNDDTNGSKELSISGLDWLTEYTVWVNTTDGYDDVDEWFTFTVKGEPGTFYENVEISSDYTIKDSSTYNVNDSDEDGAAHIISSDVTLDFNSSTLSGENLSSSCGISFSDGIDNITLKDGTIRYFMYGICGDSVTISNLTLDNMTIHHCDRHGAFLSVTGMDDFVMKNCTFYNMTRRGLNLFRTDGVTIENCVFHNITQESAPNTYGGIYFSDVSEVTIENTYLDDNANGMYMSNSNNITISNVLINNSNDAAAINGYKVDYIDISNCTIRNAYNYIYLYWGHHYWVNDSTFVNDSGVIEKYDAIHFSRSYEGYIYNCTFTDIINPVVNAVIQMSGTHDVDINKVTIDGGREGITIAGETFGDTYNITVENVTISNIETWTIICEDHVGATHDVTIKNINVTDCRTGVYVAGADDISAKNITIQHNTSARNCFGNTISGDATDVTIEDVTSGEMGTEASIFYLFNFVSGDRINVYNVSVDADGGDLIYLEETPGGDTLSNTLFKNISFDTPKKITLNDNGNSFKYSDEYDCDISVELSFTPDEWIDVYRNISADVTWINTSVIWTDNVTQGTPDVNYTLYGLDVSSFYDVYINGIEDCTILTDVTGTSDEFQVSDFTGRRDFLVTYNGSAPTATTNEVVNLTDCSGELSASINTRGYTVTSCGFEYGSDTNYGTTVTISQGAGNTYDILYNLTGLSSFDVIHYRAFIVVTGLGTIYGSDSSFAVKFYTTILADNEDYFIWFGSNTSAWGVTQYITGFDEAAEYIAIWENGTWSDTDANWDKYYGDESGTNFTVTILDVIYVNMEDSGTITIKMIPDVDVNYTKSYSNSLTNTSVNKGYNYFGYNNGSSTTLGSIATAAGLQAGESVQIWESSTSPYWSTSYLYIQGLPFNQYVAVDRDDVVRFKVNAARTWNS